ncbi:MAG: glycosyltransferase family 2 protein [Acidobacteriota bacterium]|nr:glycosyltransferase family 2 protein [Acidobacteriota bacterium]
MALDDSTSHNKTAALPRPDLSILIPAWNERANLELLIPALKDVIRKIGLTAEVIVVDGGSHDGTRETAEKLGARVLDQRERGYGGAVLTGFASAAAEYIVTLDADLSHPPVFIEEFWRRRDEAEMLIASRYVPGGRAEMSRFRQFLSIILNRTYRRLLSLPVQDVSSGFRMYSRAAVIGLKPLARDFDFQEEILILIYNRGGRVMEVPFHYMPRATGQSHAKLIKFGLAYTRTLWRMLKLRRAADSKTVRATSGTRGRP